MQKKTAYIDGESISPAQAIIMASDSIRSCGKEGTIISPDDRAKDLQINEIENANDLSSDLKHKIAVEFQRLRKLHPGWKPKKLARKAGEKYSVKFDFE